MRTDRLLRLGLWLASVVVLASQTIQPDSESPAGALLPVLIFAALTAAYLLLGTSSVAARIAAFVANESLLASALPLLLVLPAVALSSQDSALDLPDMLISAVLIFMPTAAALLSQLELKRTDIGLGLVTVAAPLALPLARRGNFGVDDVWLRVAAFCLPIALLLLTTRQQKGRLNFLFVAAVLSLWYAAEFDAFPFLALGGGAAETSYFRLALVPLLLYVLAASGRFAPVGFSFELSARDISTITTNVVFAAIILVPLGMAANFLVPGWAGTPPLTALTQFIFVYLLVALPAEILFRGVIHTYLDDTLQLGFNPTLLMSSLIFGAAYLNNSPSPAWYFVIATIAGVFFGRTFIFTRKAPAAAWVHGILNWLWGLAFHAP